ncbi:MAG TPA: DUF5667 domain-containing protein [Micromonosporaceae bacterium]|jgi:hypothetical protein
MSDSAKVERFAELLEQTGTGRHHRRPDEVDPDLTALVGVTHRLARVAAPDVRPQFRDALFADLMRTCERDGLGTRVVAWDEPTVADAAQGQGARDEQGVSARTDPTWPVNGTVAPRPRRGPDDAVPTPPQRAGSRANEKTQILRMVRRRLGSRARISAMVGITAGALAISGVALASTDAVPGDALYQVKLSSEQAQLLLAGSDADRGQLHLEFARVRLVEAGQVPPDAVPDVLAAMDREIIEGARLLFTAGVQKHDAAPIDSVAAFVTQYRRDVTQARADLTAPGDPARQSLDLLAAIETRANELRAALAHGCATTTTDQYGPKPAC